MSHYDFGNRELLVLLSVLGTNRMRDARDARDPPTQSLNDSNARAASRNGEEPKNFGENTRKALSNYRFIQKGIINAKNILDWFLGRNIQLTCEQSIAELGTQTTECERVVEDDYFDIGDVKDICPACTTSYCQAIDSIPFKSSLKLVYNDHTSHKWLLGNKYILHEALDDRPEDEYEPLVEASKALKTLAPDVPIPKVRAGWKENGKIITVSDVVPGERLYDIWWDLSGVERERIATQVAGYIAKWRESDLGRISSLTGGPIHYHDNLFGTTEDGFGPFGSDLDLWQAIEKRLQDKGTDEELIQFLKDYMPPSSPCVFTHGDLSSRNVIVHNGEVTAITGFENAASLPAWAEDDEQWKALLLRRHTRSRHYAPALDWWSLWTAVEDTTTTGGVDRCRRWRKTEVISGEAAKRLNIQTAEENAAEAHVEDLVRHAIGSDLDRSWGSSENEEEEDEYGSEETQETRKGKVRRRRGLAPYHLIQQQHHSLVESANGPPRQVMEASSKEDGKRPPNSLPPMGLSGRQGESHPIAGRDSSNADLKPEAESVARSPPPSEIMSRFSEALNLPSYTVSESARSKLRDAGSRVSERGVGGSDTTSGEGSSAAQQPARRTSILKNRVAPGSLYATISAVSTEAKPRRSQSEERDQGDGTAVNISRARPQSMIQTKLPVFRYNGLGERGRIRDGDEK
ncbi:hypothetical protein F5Y10DRAFT_280010 [Nemania abortiva]|nr:hypothetical protein F5Y10DRAFT_280010 [Nemania abortiva]